MSTESSAMENRLMGALGLGNLVETPETGEEVATEATEATQVPDFAEVEFNGAKYQIPPALKDAFLQNADYTQKTQALADERRTLEQLRELAQTGALDREFQSSIANESQELAVIDAYLAQVGKTDWANMSTDQMFRHKIEVDNIKERRQAIKDAIEGKRQTFNTNFTTKLSELRAKSRELASKSISGFTEETEKGLREFARSEGLSDREIDNVFLDPRSLKMIWKAQQYEKVAASTGKAVTAAQKVVRPGAASERIPQKTAADLNYHKALKSAATSGQKAQVIEQRLASMFKGR